MTDPLFIEQVAATLDRPGYHVAFVIHKEQIFCAYVPKAFQGPSSAVIKLLQSLFDEHRDLSFFILRNRIFTTAPVLAQCHGMVKIVAKRVSGEVPAKDHGIPIPQQVHILGGDEPFASLKLRTPENELPLEQISVLAPEVISSKQKSANGGSPGMLEWVRKVAALNPRGNVLHDYDRDIACILVADSGELLGYGLNCNSKNKTLHAEVNMVQRYFRDRGQMIPANAHIYTTRKPCKMCAGMILDACESPRSLHIHFAEEDKSSQHTVLDAVAQWNRLDSL